ncbi:hypothetical protein OG21DRAFT_1233978 [Imleria badia]|nr:hypothetical protein OG21DRAFT_1233978 [Imleria badia]
MHQFSVIFTLLSIIFLSVLAAPLPLDRSLDKRQYSGSGIGTWFYDSVNESACNTRNTDYESIVAVSVQIFNSQVFCGQTVWIYANGQTQSATVADACEGCGPGDLDMSIGLFQNFASLDTGVININWGVDSS